MNVQHSHQRLTPCEVAARARVAYTILANPFLSSRNSRKQPLWNGPFPIRQTLAVHIRLLAAFERRLAAVLLVWPADVSKLLVPGYRNFSHSLTALRPPIELFEVANNTLGSYGMFLHAFASTRGRFDFYIMCEDDYAPASPGFDIELVRLHEETFASGAPGVLAGILQGRPAEPDSKFALHLETSHIMSDASLQHLYRHTYERIGWNRSMAERMLGLLDANISADTRTGPRQRRYYGGGIQEGFGLLMADAGIEMRDWTSRYSSPYWNHEYTVDWTVAARGFQPPQKAATSRSASLFLPVQRFIVNRFVICCQPNEASCAGLKRDDVETKEQQPSHKTATGLEKSDSSCMIRSVDWMAPLIPPSSCCKFHRPAGWSTQLRAHLSVPAQVSSAQRCAEAEQDANRVELSVHAVNDIVREELQRPLPPNILREEERVMTEYWKVRRRQRLGEASRI